MPLDLDRFDLDSDDNNDIDAGCNDFGDLGLPAQRIVQNVGRSLDEILQLEIEIIEENTEFTPEEWIKRFAERFRAIITDDPTLTKFQVKHTLYLNK